MVLSGLLPIVDEEMFYFWTPAEFSYLIFWSSCYNRESTIFCAFIYISSGIGKWDVSLAVNCIVFTPKSRKDFLLVIFMCLLEPRNNSFQNNLNWNSKGAAIFRQQNFLHSGKHSFQPIFSNQQNSWYFFVVFSFDRVQLLFQSIIHREEFFPLYRIYL